MDVNTLFAVLIGGVLVNNYALEQFLGITPLLGCKKQGGKAAALGLAVTLVMVLSAAVVWPLQKFLPALDYLYTLLLPLIVLAVAYVVELVAKAGLRKSLGIYFPVIALNSAVMGLLLGIGGQENFILALVCALGVGLGFLLGLVLMSGLQDRLRSASVPKAFQGLPVQLLAAGILSMALLAFR